ncbi:MAG: hypothetical protein HYV07_21365 [Deltaproteobacteria bacterium]|nr:hypothetical protein [Deltaproteobacteria bacterium]
MGRPPGISKTRWSAAIVGASLSSACDVQSILVSLPNLEAAESLLVAIDDGQQVRYDLASLSEDSKVEVELEEGSDIYAFGLHCPHGLLSSRMRKGSDPMTLQDPPLRWVTRSIRSGVGAEWAELETVPGRIANALPFRFSPQGACVSFHRREVWIGREWINDAIALDDGSFLFTGGRWYMGRPDSLQEVLLQDPVPTDPQFVDGNGDVWLTDETGQVVIGNARDGFHIQPALRLPVPVPARIQLHGANTATQSVFFATTSDLGLNTSTNLGELRNGRWELLVDDAPAELASPPAIRWLGERRAIAGIPSSEGVVIADHGAVSREALPTVSRDSASVIAATGSGDLVVGTEFGHLLLGMPGAFHALTRGNDVRAFAIRDIAPLDTGLIYLTGTNHFWQWHPTGDTCATLSLDSKDIGHPGRLLPMGQDFLITLGVRTEPHDKIGQIIVLERRPPERCLVDDGALGEGWSAEPP